MAQRQAAPVDEWKTVDESEWKMVSTAPSKPKPAPAKGVDDPTRDMDTATLMESLRDEGAATLLEPFSARGGKGEWKVPDILSGSARALMGLMSGPRGQVDTVKGIGKGLVEPAVTLATTKDPRERVGAGVRLVRDTIPSVLGAGSLMKSPAKAALQGPVAEKLMTGAASARNLVTQQGPVAVGEVMTYPKASILKAAAGPILRGGARVAEETAMMLAKRKPGTTIAATAPEIIPDAATRAAAIESREMPMVQGPGKGIPTYDPYAPTGTRSELTPSELETGVPPKNPPPPATTDAGPLTSADLNKWMNVRENQLLYGKNPGERILSEKLLGPDKATTLQNVTTARKSVGSAMDDVFKRAESEGVKFELESDIQAAIADAKKTIGKSTDEAFMKAIEGIEGEIVSRTEDLKNMTPSAAHGLEVELGRGVKWTGASTDVQRLLKDIRGRISRKLKTIDGITPLKERWGDLYEGEQALKSSIRKDGIGRGTGSVFENLRRN